MMNLKYEYKRINSLYFSSKLPQIIVEWSDALPKTAMGGSHVHGRNPCYRKYCGDRCPGTFIRIQPILKYLELWSVAEATLIHEMAHIESLVGDRRLARHTPQWKARMRELAAAGAFDDVW